MKPEWLTIKPASTEKYAHILETTKTLGLHTVCVEAKCPNMTDCWSIGTATFMVLGDLCTRGCRFCSVSKLAKRLGTDESEPKNLALAIKKWNLDYTVITSVCRDDLEDQGAAHFAKCIMEVKKESPHTKIELLIPDFKGDTSCLRTIIEAKPDVIGHNIETVERLSPYVRDARASYHQSLQVLKSIKEINPGIYTKSAMMLGLGETDDEVIRSMKELRESRVDFLAVGQYLRPTKLQTEVKEYVKPEKFEYFRQSALKLGFLYVASGPFVRSSYKAGEFFIKSVIERNSAIC